MKQIMGKLEQEGNIYRITHKLPFKVDGKLSREDIEACFDFAYEMAFGEGKHRRSRSGGVKERTSGEIFIDTFQGKAAEYAIYRYLFRFGIETSKPDMTIEGYGVWDAFDIEYADLYIAVKSTKYYGNLLLLETKDWNEEGEYIPNIEAGIGQYDLIVLVRISPDIEGEMKTRMLTYKRNIEKISLKDVVFDKIWKYNIAGFITNKDLKRLIEKEYILPQGALLNGTTRMDAENYYVQAGDMRPSQELLLRLKRNKQIIESR